MKKTRLKLLVEQNVIRIPGFQLIWLHDNKDISGPEEATCFKNAFLEILRVGSAHLANIFV